MSSSITRRVCTIESIEGKSVSDVSSCDSSSSMSTSCGVAAPIMEAEVLARRSRFLLSTSLGIKGELEPMVDFLDPFEPREDLRGGTEDAFSKSDTLVDGSCLSSDTDIGDDKEDSRAGESAASSGLSPNFEPEVTTSSLSRDECDEEALGLRRSFVSNADSDAFDVGDA